MIENKLTRIIEWTKLKIRIISNKDISFYFYEREIWWASLGCNIGFEEDGKNRNFERPVLIWKKFNKDMLWAIPLTTKQKEGKFFYTFVENDKSYTLIWPQLRLISSKRLIRKMTKISKATIELIKKEIINNL
ncbi:type II toxin-antitoxin system PemK/MazF family toxin [Patescibacteria group bacterium]|nr:type II toxin-antitoxin system PemK/MazF family toxin [Patescibacteria group bacterium]